MTVDALVLWDIDRTLLYVGEVDQRAFRDVYVELVGRAPAVLPERGTGVTTPVVLQRMFQAGGVPPAQIAALTAHAVAILPRHLADRRGELRREGAVMPGARAALAAVAAHPGLAQTVVTGNLRATALIKLASFGLDRFLDLDIGGFACDDANRPNLVGIARQRATRRHGTVFDYANSVIVGDSLEDVRTGRLGGCAVIGVASGTADRDRLAEAGADMVLDDLTDTTTLMAAVQAYTGLHRLAQCRRPVDRDER